LEIAPGAAFAWVPHGRARASADPPKELQEAENQEVGPYSGEAQLRPAIGGLVGNAFTQLTRVQGPWNRGRHIIVPPLPSDAVMPTLPGHSRWLMEQRG
jgi:hypothetical protein